MKQHCYLIGRKFVELSRATLAENDIGAVRIPQHELRLALTIEWIRGNHVPGSHSSGTGSVQCSPRGHSQPLAPGRTIDQAIGADRQNRPFTTGDVREQAGELCLARGSRVRNGTGRCPFHVGFQPVDHAGVHRSRLTVWELQRRLSGGYVFALWQTRRCGRCSSDPGSAVGPGDPAGWLSGSRPHARLFHDPRRIALATGTSLYLDTRRVFTGRGSGVQPGEGFGALPFVSTS